MWQHLPQVLTAHAAEVGACGLDTLSVFTEVGGSSTLGRTEALGTANQRYTTGVARACVHTPPVAAALVLAPLPAAAIDIGDAQRLESKRLRQLEVAGLRSTRGEAADRTTNAASRLPAEAARIQAGSEEVSGGNG